MKDFLPNFVNALREELKEYGEMLALLDRQQEMVVRRETQDLIQCVQAINAQVEAISAARRTREQIQREAAQIYSLPEDVSFQILFPHLPSEYRPLVEALVNENNDLLKTIQRRARQNHLLLSRIVELMQRLFDPFFPGARPATYNEAGAMAAITPLNHSIYEAVG